MRMSSPPNLLRIAEYSASVEAGKTPLPGKGGEATPVTKCREASLVGVDGVVGSSYRLFAVERTTPRAPSEEREYCLMARPPLLIQGGEIRSLSEASQNY